MSPRLLVLDVDSTLITSEVIEMLAGHAGSRAEVARITEAAMRGKLDFAESLRQRVSTLAGLPESVFAEVLDEASFTPGAEMLISTVQQHGWQVALVSGGFAEVVEPLAGRLGIEHCRANRLEIVDGVLTGRTTGAVIDRAAKAAALREFAATTGTALSDTVAVGDGANDLDMLDAAGLGIAFNAKPIVRQHADVSLEADGLDAVLEVLSLA